MTIDRYAVYVDISAKIEAWNKRSIITVANSHTRSLLITAEVKQLAARLVVTTEPPQYVLMAVFAYILVVPDIERVSSVTLDRDYSGEVAERIIVRRLLSLLRTHRPKLKASAIRMDNIAGSRADKLARITYKGRKQPDGEITIADIAAVLLAQK